MYKTRNITFIFQNFEKIFQKRKKNVKIFCGFWRMNKLIWKEKIYKLDIFLPIF